MPSILFGVGSLNPNEQGYPSLSTHPYYLAAPTGLGPCQSSLLGPWSVTICSDTEAVSPAQNMICLPKEHTEFREVDLKITETYTQSVLPMLGDPQVE